MTPLAAKKKVYIYRKTSLLLLLSVTSVNTFLSRLRIQPSYSGTESFECTATPQTQRNKRTIFTNVTAHCASFMLQSVKSEPHTGTCCKYTEKLLVATKKSTVVEGHYKLMNMARYRLDVAMVTHETTDSTT